MSLLRKKRSKKKKQNMSEKRSLHEQCKLGWIVITLVLVTLTLVNVLITNIFVAKQDSIFRICFTALPQNVIGAPGEANARVTGMITLDQNGDSVSYEARTVVGMSSITSIVVMGPTPLGSGIGPVSLILCGTSPAAACDTTTTPGLVQGVVYEVVPNDSIRTFMKALREKPYLYYVEILTNAKPVTPGAVRADVTATCGFA